MSKPINGTQVKAAFKKWNVSASYLSGFETRGRPASTAGGPFVDVRGIIIHHTASEQQSASYVDWLFKVGRADLPAPLCQFATNKQGLTYVGALGKANHAGAGSASVLEAVKSENYDGFNKELKGGNSVNGNPSFYGNEVMYGGVNGQDMTDDQYKAVVRFCAALCDFHGWTAKSVIGHREWSSTKIDPSYVKMYTLRKDVQALLDKGPTGEITPPVVVDPVPPVVPPKEIDKLDAKSYPPNGPSTGPHITWLGQRLVLHGFKGYTVGPGPEWGAADKAGVKWFQEKQGWTGSDADGYVGPTTLKLLAVDPVIVQPEPPKTIDRLNPASYPPKGLSVGPHITWLGQRLVVHGFKGYKVGPGPEWGSADKAGVKWFQEKQGWKGADADGYVGKETLKRLAADPVKPKPEPTVESWFKLMTWNISNNNKIGISRWTTRRSKVVKEVNAQKPDVFCTQENVVAVGKASGRAYLDAHISGMKRVSGGDGRYIYLRNTHKRVAGGVFDLQPRYQKDDKQAAWVVAEIDGIRVLITSYHLENEGSSDSTRIAQMESCISQAKSKAKEYKVDTNHIIHAGDTNFKTSGAISTIERKGFVDLYNSAKTQVDKAYRSLNSWSKSPKGFRIDRVWGTAKLKVIKADQRLSLFTIADHNPQTFWIGK